LHGTVDSNSEVGSPARHVRDLRPDELEEMAYLTRHYVKLGAAYGDR
jgi:carbonic anhydrase/acetyltransferase-like protein (isoleucine patch superfamily)